MAAKRIDKGEAAAYRARRRRQDAERRQAVRHGAIDAVLARRQAEVMAAFREHRNG